MGECLYFLSFAFFLPFFLSLVCCDTNGNSLKLLNTLVILSMNLPFRSLLDMEYEGLEAHYCRVVRNMDRAKPIFSAIHGVWQYGNELFAGVHGKLDGLKEKHSRAVDAKAYEVNDFIRDCLSLYHSMAYSEISPSSSSSDVSRT